MSRILPPKVGERALRKSRIRRLHIHRLRDLRERQGRLHLNAFVNCKCGYQSADIMTNSALSAPGHVERHNRRGTQESLFAQLKSRTQTMHPRRRCCAANQA